MASTSGTIVLVDREQGRVLSPLGSKIAASSTGAISTALLSTFPVDQGQTMRHDLDIFISMIPRSDPIRCPKDENANGFSSTNTSSTS
jgi:hypothetical protein